MVQIIPIESPQNSLAKYNHLIDVAIAMQIQLLIIGKPEKQRDHLRPKVSEIIVGKYDLSTTYCWPKLFKYILWTQIFWLAPVLQKFATKRKEIIA